ncbi:hypothetical protein GUJ93_ZPchr0006g44755 [Zizania palustris]|uniref:Uncharacterized protein n=1 Tax=Zizania palustris TaxID=103762 RepID=A0A8J5VV55_ZIZPA|nr:hypothetical protein GUJ93_ZPchr0006g44755 [Zizania palustris]
MAGSRGGFELLHVVAPSMMQQLHYLEERHKITGRLLVAFLQVVQLLPQACCLPLPNLSVKNKVLSVSLTY